MQRKAPRNTPPPAQSPPASKTLRQRKKCKQPDDKYLKPLFAADEIILKLKSDADRRMLIGTNAARNTVTGLSSLDKLNDKFGVGKMSRILGKMSKRKKLSPKAQRLYRGLLRLYKLKLKNKADILKVASEYNMDPNVEYAEPNYAYSINSTTPADPDFSKLWGMHNTGQSGGAPGADIDAAEAWDINRGSKNIIVAVIDTGVDYNHQDLAGNMWTNPGEIAGNGIDDDLNGHVDDIHGINTITRSGDPADDNGHGTHCAGTIGAVGNNGMGVAGVNWGVNIMGLKFLDSIGWGFLSDSLVCISYAIDMGAHIMSNSWGGRFSSNALKDAIEAANSAGVLFVAAAGNDYRNNNDLNQFYPAGYDNENIIAVAATDHNDSLASFSNYGPASVDVAAPGVNIYSCLPGNSYGYKSGTSMATPHVAGLAALVWDEYWGDIDHLEVKRGILASVDKLPQLTAKMVSGGRINAYRALTETVTGPHIYSISPDSGMVGRSVTILGNDFAESQGGVIFYGGVSAPIISWSDSEIVCTVPDGAASGDVMVDTMEGASNGKLFTVCSSTLTYYRDEDGDGYGNPDHTIQACFAPPGYVSDNSDCDDSRGFVSPGAEEVCGNNINDDCDGETDEVACVEKRIFVPRDYATIQAAINAAEVWNSVEVSDGTYYENIDFKGKKIAVRSANGLETTIIDGRNLGGSVVSFKSGEGADSVLEGFTITGGRGTQVMLGPKIYFLGGGINCLGGSPLINNCIIRDNSVMRRDGMGGGIACTFSSPMITNCTITGNRAEDGGGVFCWQFSSPLIKDCTISNNTTDSIGGGIASFGLSSPNITGCTISNNSAAGCGGGVWCGYYSLVSNCIITGNASYNCGGGVYCSWSATLTDCLIDGNYSSGSGGGVECSDTSIITNCIITNNSSFEGGGISSWFTPSPVIANCTISDNKSFYGGGIHCWDSNPTVTNSIIWRNSAMFAADEIYLDNEGSNYPSSINLNYSIIDGGWGTPDEMDQNHNSDAGPLFVDPDHVNYRLQTGSPAIDTGTGDTDTYPELPIDDIDGETRPQGTSYDIGADEYLHTDTSPDIPGNLSVVGTTSVRIRLSWQDNSDNEHGFKIERKRGSGETYSLLAVTGPDKTTYQDTGLSPETTYFYRIRVYNGAGGSGWTNEATATTDSTLTVCTSGCDYISIQSAIDASSYEDTVLVKDGTYVENINFSGKAIILRSENGPEVTIIDGGGIDSVVTFNSYERPDSTLDGFTLTKGSAVSGGGINCDTSSPKITNCIITANSASWAGGGVSFDDSSRPLLGNCTISNNSARRGGGISCYNNDPLIENCVISSNSAEDGGGIFGAFFTSPMITDSIISGNWVSGTGGGISLWDASSVIFNTVITGNSTSFYAGGIDCESCSLVVANATIAANHGSGIGAFSVSYQRPSVVEVTNSIIWGNEYNGYPTQIHVTDGNGGNASAVVSYSDVEGGWPGTGNINEMPYFIYWRFVGDAPTAEGDYHLQHVSAGIDAAGSDLPAFSTDKDGNLRFDNPDVPNTGAGVNGNFYDMGAYENQGSTVLYSPPTIEPIIEPQHRYYSVAPTFSNFGFDDNIDLDDGWYQIDSHIGAWTVLFENVSGTQYNYDGWAIPGFDGLGEGSHNIYFKASDDAGSVGGGSGRWHWQFYKDITPPAAPIISSPTHPDQGYHYPGNDPVLTWTEPADVSAISGYSYLLDQLNDSVPDDVSEGTDTNTSFADLANGSWYFHVRAIDGAGNAGATAHFTINIAEERTLYVPGNDYNTIQDAIDAALERDTIMVAPGTYYENIDFLGKEIVARSEYGPEVTIIDGNNSGSVVTFRSGENLSTTLSGFTITGGTGTVGEYSYYKYGGGIYCDHSTPTITNCIIINNTLDLTYGSGGGIALRHASAVISDCIIKNNSALVTNGGGGGISCYYSSPIITNSTIYGNAAADEGGAIEAYEYSSPTIINCTISGNHAFRYGGGISVAYRCSPKIVNSILWGNIAGDEGDEIDLGSSTSSISVAYSNIQNGWEGVENIDADPIFIDPRPASEAPTSAGDYHLYPASPCIDTATDDSQIYPGLPLTDIDGDNRPLREGYDSGSDEYAGSITICRDSDGDGYFSEQGCGPGGVDCNNNDPGINPGADELCDGVDNDCNPDTPDGADELWLETDCDGFDLDLCDEGVLVCADGTRSCTDNTADNPELCDGVDNDCNGVLDDQLSLKTFYHDADQDSFGDLNGPIQACAAPPGYVSDNTDCDDTHWSVNPSMEEICDNAINDNCDGQTDEPGCRQCQIFYVPDDFPTIQEAIDLTPDGCTVIVRDGTYTENIDFKGKAITLRSENGPQVTIIDGSRNKNVVIFISDEDENSVLDGFTIRNGLATEVTTGGMLPRSGAGIFCDYGSSPSINNCIITGNSAKYGAGVYCQGSSASITNCDISNNSASEYGGGIYFAGSSSPTIINCTISNNSAGYGGGAYFNTLSSMTDCVITGNSADNGGGGIYTSADSASIISGCTIRNNSARNGGGIYCDWASGTIIGCVIQGNSSILYSGGIGLYKSSPKITNCLISGNTAQYGGGAMRLYYASPTITNCTITGNANSLEDKYGGGIYCYYDAHPLVINTILWGNEENGNPDEIFVYEDNASITVKHSLINPAHISGTGDKFLSDNINSGPLFINPRPATEAPTGGGDYHLLSNSPCIDSGTDNEYPDLPTDDIDGNSRPQDGNDDGAAEYDMGSYEYSGPCTDTDGDGYYVEEWCGTPVDNCQDDPHKTGPGACGCGVEDVDSDADLTPDCNESCPNDPLKTEPGVCDCGTPDTDSDSDATPDCNDICPDDPHKTGPGACGCGVEDVDSDGDGYFSQAGCGTEVDCDDGSRLISPGAVEECDDGIDNNCDGEIDEGCVADGDVNGDGDITPRDALMVYRHYLGFIELDDLSRCDVNRDDNITPADAHCIFQKYLGLPSCLDD